VNFVTKLLPHKRFDNHFKMVGTNAKMFAIRMVRSKLRKRDENGVRQDHVILHPAQQNNHCHHNNNCSGAATAPTTTNGGTTIATVSETVKYTPVPSPTDATSAANSNSTPRQFLWQFPATHPCGNNDRVSTVKFQLGVSCAERSLKMWHFWSQRYS
jgi:hypothetical protein